MVTPYAAFGPSAAARSGEHMAVNTATIVRANGVDLCAQSFGDPADPPVLLIAGAGSSMLGWPDDFCARLAAGARFVLRYDHRDTGESAGDPPGAPSYDLDDLAADALGLLDAFDLPAAHLVGISMGGGIGQLLALREPARVRSLTLIASSPGPAVAGLPGMSDDTIGRFQALPTPDFADPAATVEYLVALERACAAASYPFDDADARTGAVRDVGRARDIGALSNHFGLPGGAGPVPPLGQLSAPTLVVHGTEDPVLPYPHGVALADHIPAATLLTLDRTGHELPRRCWDVVLTAVLRHTERH